MLTAVQYHANLLVVTVKYIDYFLHIFSVVRLSGFLLKMHTFSTACLFLIFSYRLSRYVGMPEDDQDYDLSDGRYRLVFARKISENMAHMENKGVSRQCI